MNAKTVYLVKIVDYATDERSFIGLFDDPELADKASDYAIKNFKKHFPNANYDEDRFFTIVSKLKMNMFAPANDFYGEEEDWNEG